MPTSSQALILKGTDGYLPPVFGRRYWRPAQSHLYPITSIYVPERRHQSRDSKERRFRPGSAHAIRHDHSTLPEVLRIRGLKGLSGSLDYDSTSNSFRYEVESMPKTRVNNWTQASNSLKFYRHVYQTNAGSDRNHSTNAPSSYIPNGNARSSTQGIPQHYKKGPNLQRHYKFVNMESSGEEVQLAQSDQDLTDFFKLVKVLAKEARQKACLKTETGQNPYLETETGQNPYLETDTGQNPYLETETSQNPYPETETGQHSYLETETDQQPYLETETGQNVCEQNVFRLIKALPTESGAFRLAKTAPKQVGQLYLVPPEGCESDDFRLVPSEYPGCYTILQADPWAPDTFKELKSENVHGNEFKLVSAKIRDPPITMSRKYLINDDFNRVNEIFPDKRSSEVRSSQIRDGMHESLMKYDNVDDILENPTIPREARSKELSLPDIMLHNPNKRLHKPMQVRVEEDEDSYNFNSEEFAAKYMGDIRENSTEVYERLVNLGFRRSHDDTEHPKFAAKTGDSVAGSNSKLPSCDWRMYNFDKWTRTTEAPQSNQALMSVESAKLFRQPGQSTNPEVTQKASLLEELKMNSNYKLWKKKKATGIRMRKELPPEDATAVCLSLKDNAIAHDVLLSQVQKETGNQLTSLQFDPVSVHSQESDVKSQWILRFSGESVCENLLNFGINILGTTYQVRRFNDVMKEEHEAYKFSVIIQKIKEHKLKEQMAQKSQKPNKRLKTTQTQTPRGTL